MALINGLFLKMSTLTVIKYFSFEDSDNPFPEINDEYEIDLHKNCVYPYTAYANIPNHMQHRQGWANFAREVDNWCWDTYQFRIRHQNGTLLMPWALSGCSVVQQWVTFRREEDRVLFQLRWS